ncbi:MAG: ribose 1,5-bisphosphate isomerase, partial [Thermoplasmata archaeon]
EKNIVNYVKEIYPGLFVTGMAAVSVFGAPRMGPIFGGMLISGRDVAVKVDKKLGGVP